MGEVRIFTNSAADLPPALCASLGVTIVPDYIIFSPTEQLRNAVDITPPELYRRLAASKTLPKTAHPGPKQFMDAFSSVTDGEILLICLTSEMCGAYGTACAARQLLQEQGFSVPITVYDSRQVSFGLGLLVLEAARMAAAGACSGEITARLDSLRDHIGVYFAMESLENARRGGRVGAIRVLAADMLRVKPVLEFRDGLVRDVEIVRGYSTAVDHVIARYGRQARFGGEVFVFHADREELAEEVARRVAAADPSAVIRTGWVSGVIGIYTGAGCIGIAFYER